jgi:phage terminase large subunit
MQSLLKANRLAVDVPDVYRPVFSDKRYIGCRGGRGAGRSWTVAIKLVAKARSVKNRRILCTREYQTSIAESVHQDLKNQINRLGVAGEFRITDRSIKCMHTDSEFIFKGLRYDPEGIKSLSGLTDVWIEEAHSVSAKSLVILDPTIGRDAGPAGSQFIATWNTEDKDAPIEEFFRTVVDPEDSIIVDSNYRDNPFFPVNLEKQRIRAEAVANETGDWDAYNWIWLGEYRTISDAVVFGRRVIIEDFETPDNVRFYHGADWGFANDPTALVRCYITGDDDSGKHLWIDREAFGYKTELDEIAALFDTIPTARKWSIKADNSRPETISYIKRTGFPIKAAEKWPGSVEDGIAYLKGFTKIHIHSRCKHMIEESKLYSYKKDRFTEEVLPVLVDAYNHGWDSVRYSLDTQIKFQHKIRITGDAMRRASLPPGVDRLVGVATSSVKKQPARPGRFGGMFNR